MRQAFSLGHILRSNPSRLEELWKQVQKAAPDAERDRAALEEVLSWSFRNHSKFHHEDAREQNQGEPPDGWAGLWNRAAMNGICFFPDKLKALLERFELPPQATLIQWRDRGWLKTSGKGRLTYQRRYLERQVWFHCIAQAAIDELHPESHDERQ